MEDSIKGNSSKVNVAARKGLPLFEELPKQSDMVFDAAIQRVFKHEGYWSHDVNDPGGATKYGVSLRFARSVGDLDGDGRLDLDLDGDGDVDAEDIKLLTAEQAIQIYRRMFWDPFPYSKLVPAVAVKVFDLTVNMGSKQSHIILQRAVRSAIGEKLVEDGVIGIKTINAAQRAYSSTLLACMRSEAAGFYRGLIVQRPASKKYINGWLNRAYS